MKEVAAMKTSKIMIRTGMGIVRFLAAGVMAFMFYVSCAGIASSAEREAILPGLYELQNDRMSGGFLLTRTNDGYNAKIELFTTDEMPDFA